MIESAGQGNDTILCRIDYVLAAGQEVETMRVHSRLGLTVTANELGTYLVGNVGNDTLNGGAGNDRLLGGLGEDVMAGGAGNDTYYVENHDQVIEGTGQGIDTILTSIGYFLAPGQSVEILRARGTRNVSLSGNEIANSIYGGTASDTLYGGGGNDRLYGGDGQDRLYGEAGNDVMAGSAGDDLYYVTNVGDTVIEKAGEGRDTIYSTVDYVLTAGQEVEYLRAVDWSANRTLTGNEFDNNIFGRAGDDTLNGVGGNDHLDGSKGNDVMTGGTGNDTYYVADMGDQVFESAGQGIDTIYSSVDYSLAAGQSVEYLRVRGSTGRILEGNELTNRVIGGVGSDTLSGGGGSDVVNGGAGNDVLNGATAPTR